MSAPVKILLVGIGGYGNNYVNALLDERRTGETVIVGVVDPNPEGCSRVADIREAGIPIYRDLVQFYGQNRADLAIVSSPIHWHASQTITCLENGSHVLCEKPAAAVIQDTQAMSETAERMKRMLAIGYQWSYNPAVQSLKQDILAGKWGRPLQLKTLVLWPRDNVYYNRPWAGKRRSEDGRWILDSVANNATAHYLHNMLYVLGPSVQDSVSLEYLEGEVYRAQEIENYDTAALRIQTTEGSELLFYASHSTHETQEPVFEYRFENGVVRYGVTEDGHHSNRFVGYTEDGSVIDYGDPNADRFRHLWLMVEAIADGVPIDICGIRAASAHTLCINALQDQYAEVPSFPSECRVMDEAENRIWVKQLGPDLVTCYLKGQLPSEMGMGWSREKVHAQLANYQRFSG